MEPFGKGTTAVTQRDPLASRPHAGPGNFTPGTSKSEETFRTSSPCRGEEVGAQRRRQAQDSQLVVAELRLPDTRPLPSPLARVQVLLDTDFPPYTPHPCSARALNTKACLQHPSPHWLGPRHPEPARPQCREHPIAVATPC